MLYCQTVLQSDWSSWSGYIVKQFCSQTGPVEVVILSNSSAVRLVQLEWLYCQTVLQSDWSSWSGYIVK